MAPTIILIRHAEAESNARKDFTLPDPPLTARGLKQCKELAAVLQEHDLYSKIGLIITSPMNRAIETTFAALGPLIEEKKVPVILSALFQENSTVPSDCGTSLSVLRKRHTHPSLTWSQVDPAYPTKTDIYAFNQEAITLRGTVALNILNKRPEKVIVIVSHGGFLRTGLSNKWYGNADFRIFEMAEGGDKGLRLVESDETEGEEGIRCGGMGRSWGGAGGFETQTWWGSPEPPKEET